MRNVNVLVFGDSIAYGACDPENGGWVNRLRLKLEKKDKAYYQVFNLGIPGDTTKNIISRFRRDCKSRYNPDVDTIIVFAIGINNTQIINDKNIVSEIGFRRDIIKLIATAREYTDKILFVGLTPVDESRVVPTPWDSRISYHNVEIFRFTSFLENICGYYDVEYINVLNLIENEDLEDGLHPNSEGHQKLCNKIAKYVEAF